LEGISLLYGCFQRKRVILDADSERHFIPLSRVRKSRIFETESGAALTDPNCHEQRL